MTRLLSLLLALAYPALAHAAALTHNPTLILLAGLDLALLVLLEPLLRLRVWAMVALGVALGLLAWLYHADLAMLPLYAPPVLLNLFMAWVFGHTLLAGRMPLIERLARVLHGDATPLPEGVPAYARTLTGLWMALFIVLATVSFVLALLASPDGLLLSFGILPPVTVEQATWSLFANVINYVVVVVFFIGEFVWRQRRFPGQTEGGLIGFCRRMAALGPGFWRRLAD